VGGICHLGRGHRRFNAVDDGDGREIDFPAYASTFRVRRPGGGIIGLSMLISFRGGRSRGPGGEFLGLAVSNIVTGSGCQHDGSRLPTTVFVLEMFSSSIYLGAYLVLVFGFYRHYLLRYGPPSTSSATRPPARRPDDLLIPGHYPTRLH
jgi:hypothetical protein